MSEAALMAEPAPTATETADTFEELYRRTFPRVYAYVATLLRDRSAAEEVTAQAFERAYRKQRTFKRSKGSAGVRCEPTTSPTASPGCARRWPCSMS